MRRNASDALLVLTVLRVWMLTVLHIHAAVAVVVGVDPN
jgi:hypothetical protein